MYRLLSSTYCIAGVSVWECVVCRESKISETRVSVSAHGFAHLFPPPSRLSVRSSRGPRVVDRYLVLLPRRRFRGRRALPRLPVHTPHVYCSLSAGNEPPKQRLLWPHVCISVLWGSRSLYSIVGRVNDRDVKFQQTRTICKIIRLWTNA